MLGEFGGKPAHCGRKYLERSSTCWKYEEKANMISELNGKQLVKVVIKSGIGLLHGYDIKK